MGKQILSLYRPHPKQAEFHKAGADHTERLLMAGNRNGKSEAGGAESAIHLTGRYPDWWEGRRFKHAVRWWAAGITNKKTRDVSQRKLFGVPSKIGSGFVPKALIKNVVMSRGMPGSIDYAEVQHESGELSMVSFLSYEQGWEKFESDDIDGAWLDEESSPKIYSAVQARTIDRDGMTITTFTPLLGISDVVALFHPVPTTAARHLTHMAIEDALHIPVERRAAIIAKFPEHEREARARGNPMLGEGRVFVIPESSIVTPAFKIPRHWARLGGMDFGYDHPFGAVSVAWDRDSDVLYVTDCFKDRQSTPPIHAAAIKPWGEWIQYAWPHDGGQHDKGSGDALADQYRVQGVRMLPFHSTFKDGGYSPEAAVLEARTRMQTGRLKVFSHLEPWLAEYRQYHRKDGRIVAKFDDLLSATWKVLMMLRFARTNDTPQMPTKVEDWEPLAAAI